jgi:hypothetical protein
MSKKYPGGFITNLGTVGYSVFFGGTGDYLSAPANAAFAFGTGNFTVEAWVFIQSYSDARFVFDTRSSVSTAGMGFRVQTNGSLGYSDSANNTLTSTGLVPLNTWTHIAWVRSGTTLTGYVNGVSGGSVSNSANITQNNGVIGAVGFSSGERMFGYISNLRIVKGTALYTANFTPPTQLLNVTNTSLLTCNSPAIVDQSSNNFPITVNGNAAVSTLTPFPVYNAYNPALGASTPGVWTLDQALQAAATRQWNMYDPYFNLTTLYLPGNSPTNVPTWITDASTNNFAITVNGDTRAAGLSPFSLTTYPNSGSGYFDGTGDFLTYQPASGSSAFNLSTGDWTIEAWVYRLASGVGHNILNLYNSAGNNSGLSFYINTSNQLSQDNGLTGTTAAGTVPANAWTHVAAVRTSGNTQLYVNGIAVGSAITQAPNTAQFFQIGFAPSGVQSMNGYISNVRVVKGVAVYTGAFTVPTAPLGATQSAGTNISAITGTSTSLLTLQNSQSSNNNAFLDSSSNNFLITRNGNTTQGTFSPFSQTGWSNFFAGSGNNLTIATTTAFGVGTGDFTLECWVFCAFTGADQTIIDFRGSLTATPWAFSVSSTGLARTYDGSSVRSGGQLTANSWNHVAWVRASNVNTVYVNGVSGHTWTATTNFGSTNPATIAASIGGGEAYTGYISNLRFLKGTALYTTTFTPPTSPLTNITNTSLLTCQSNRFVDNSTNNFTLTPNGTPSVQAFSPFAPTAAYSAGANGGSGYFDGTGDYLGCGTQTAYSFGTGTFTIEAWVYVTSRASEYNIASTRGSAGTVNGWSFAVSTSGGLILYSNNWIFNSVGTVPLNAWTHVAVTREGTGSNQTKAYINGVNVASATNSENFTNTTLAIGSANDGSQFSFLGYISGFRMLKGTALTSFTLTSPPTAIANTSILTNFTNAGITDATAKNVLETVGNAQISTAQSKFGGSSMYFDGTGDFLLQTANLVNYVFGTGDFTIEAWVYRLDSGVQRGIVDTRSASVTGVYFYILSNNRLAVFDSSSVFITSTNTVPSNTWVHVAVSRASGTTRLFINGAVEATASDSRNYNCSFLHVGRLQGSTGDDWFGYIDDLRITKGFARYTANFTPPTSALQQQ